MRLTIKIIIILMLGGSFLYWSENQEIEEKKAIEQIELDSIARLDAIFQSFYNQPFIDSLDLSNIGLKELPDDFLSKFVQLKYLNLSGNQFKTIPFGVLLHSTLMTLDMSDNQLKALDRHFQKNLKVLNLSHNQIDKMNITVLNNLTELDMSYNKLKYSLDFQDVKLRNLTKINVSHNKINTIRGIDGLENLSVLIANHNELTDIPTFLFNEKLTYLDLSNNEIFNFIFPHYTDILLKLKTIKINSNKIEHIYQNVALSNLEKLNLEDNNLKSFSNLQNSYPNLKYLNVKYNSGIHAETEAFSYIDSVIY